MTDSDSHGHVHISVVAPAYKCAACIGELYRRLVQALEALTASFEIIFVDDRSPENDWDIICRLAGGDARVKGIQLSANFGQQVAIAAGLDYARGDWVVVMDCDLQDQPEEIQKLYRKAQEGYDIVLARRIERRHGLFRTLSSRLFGLAYGYLANIEFDSATGNFSIASQKVVRCLRTYRERNRVFITLLSSVGFKQALIDVEHAPRFAGKTSYTFSLLTDFAIQSIVASSNKPLRLSIKFGFLLAGLSMALGLVLTLRYMFFSVGVEGWTSIMVLLSFLSGLLLANVGIVGLYLGRVFDEVKNRPLYSVDTLRNIDAPPERHYYPPIR